jgi:predicted nucleotidyltransferase
LGDTGHVRILRVLLLFGGALSIPQIAGETGLTRQAVRFVLDRLITRGAVHAIGTPRSRLYEVTLGDPLVAALQPLFSMERARWETLLSALRDVLSAHTEVRSAWLYGSVARGEDTPTSDLDVTVVVTDNSSEGGLRDDLDGLETRFGIDVSLIVLTSKDIRGHGRHDPWWAGLERDAQILVGLSPADEHARARV